MEMRAIAGVQLRTTETKRNPDPNTSQNPTPNNPAYHTDPTKPSTISRFTSVHQQARIPAFYHLLSAYRLNTNTRPNGNPNGEGMGVNGVYIFLLLTKFSYVFKSVS